MKNILYAIFLVLLFGCHEPVKEKKVLIDVKKCSSDISIDKYGRTTKFYSNPDTIKLNSSSFLVVSLYSCEGEMDFEEFSIDSGLVLKGYYKGAEKLTHGVSEKINPMDGTSTSDSISYYTPKKTGEWEYFNKSGKIIKTEKY
jgi:hypothetical protein